jgi:hypothetical protein
MNRHFWLATLAYLLPTFPLGNVWHLVIFNEAKLFSTRREDWLASAAKFAALFGILAWSLTTLPVADFLKLETAFTVVQFLVVAPLVALSFRGLASAAKPEIP